MRVEDLSQIAKVLAASAFSALDLVYHLVALSLNLIGAVVWTSFSSLAWSLRLVGVSRPL